MKWIQIKEKKWVKHIKGNIYLALVIEEYTLEMIQKNCELKVMQVDIAKIQKYFIHAAEKEIEFKKWMKPSFEIKENRIDVTEGLAACLYALEKGKSIVTIKNENYNIMEQHIQKRYNIPIENKEKILS